MNRILAILFLIAGVFHTLGQSDPNPKIQRLLSIAKNTTFPEFWSEFKPFKDSCSNELIGGNLRMFGSRNKFRSYGFGISEFRLEVGRISEVKNSSFWSDNYRLRILFDDEDSTIFYKSFKECHGHGYNEFETTVELWYDSTSFESCFALHDSLYGTYTERNYENPPFISNKYYGPLCMNHGSDQHDQMLVEVENNRKEVLLNWIRSFNIEDKAYGAAGLYFLRKKGIELTKEEQLLLERTQKLRADVQTDLRVSYLLLMIHDKTLERRYTNYCED